MANRFVLDQLALVRLNVMRKRYANAWALAQLPVCAQCGRKHPPSPFAHMEVHVVREEPPEDPPAPPTSTNLQ